MRDSRFSRVKDRRKAKVGRRQCAEGKTKQNRKPQPLLNYPRDHGTLAFSTCHMSSITSFCTKEWRQLHFRTSLPSLWWRQLSPCEMKHWQLPDAAAHPLARLSLPVTEIRFPRKIILPLQLLSKAGLQHLCARDTERFLIKASPLQQCRRRLFTQQNLLYTQTRLQYLCAYWDRSLHMLAL